VRQSVRNAKHKSDLSVGRVRLWSSPVRFRLVVNLGPSDVTPSPIDGISDYRTLVGARGRPGWSKHVDTICNGGPLLAPLRHRCFSS